MGEVIKKGLVKVITAGIILGVSAGSTTLCDAMDSTSSKIAFFSYNGEARDSFEKVLRGKLIQYRKVESNGAQITDSEEKEFFHKFLAKNDLTLSTTGKIVYNSSNVKVYFDELEKLVPNYKPSN